MNVLYYLVITLHVIACLFLIGVVLLQQGKGQDLASAFGGGVTQTAFGPRGSANLLSRMTTILAGVFMVSSLSLSVLQPRSRSGLENLPAAPAPPSAPAPSTTGSNPESAVPSSNSAPSTLEPPPPADGAAKPESSAPAPAAGDKAGVDRPLTQKDVGPGAK